MTQGKTSLTPKIVSAGRLYGLGSGGPPGGNHQFTMDRPSRGIYRDYTHVDPCLDVSAEVQGAAPAVTTRPSPGAEIMAPGGTFHTGVNNRINNRLNAGIVVPGYTVDDAIFLARSYSFSNVNGYQNPAWSKVTAVIDAYATAFYSGTYTVGAGWGGAFSALGQAIQLLENQLTPVLDTVVNYGSTGGDKTRRAAWGDMLYASREFGRLNRDSRFITNQGIGADANIYRANKGLLLLGDARAFPEAEAQRYLREACGLAPWLGSDLPGGGSSKPYGTAYHQVTSKGLTREHGYVGTSYGELATAVAEFYHMTGNPAFLAQALKMSKARAPFRRPAIEVSGSDRFRSMEVISLLAWRGVGESDGEFGNTIAYVDSSEWARGLHMAAITQDPALVGGAKQLLADNQYFVSLTRDNRYYNFTAALEAFGDYATVSALADTGTRLPMTEGQPDFAWADEENRIVALKHGNERLWITPFWQAKSGTGINAIARFHYSTPTYDQYGVLETVPQFTASGSFVRPLNMIDKPESTEYSPPNPPLQAYGNEELPLGTKPADASDDRAFRGKADFYAFRFGHFLIGLNATADTAYTLKAPVGLASAPDLFSGSTVTGDVAVAPASTVALYLSDTTDTSPLPGTPLMVNAAGSGSGMTVSWSATSGATSYRVTRATSLAGPFTTLATGVTGTSYTDTTVSAAGVYYYQVMAANAQGEGYPSMKALGLSLGLPAPWADADIGTVGVAGSAAYNSTNGSFIIKGSGSDIGGTADGLHFGYRSLTGDGVLIARVASRINAGGSDKVGLMIRESLNANAKAVALILSSAENATRVLTRSSTGGATSSVTASSLTASVPKWLKLQRAGNTFTAFGSLDGATWTIVGTATFAMNSTAQIGFAVCSRHNTALDTTTYDNISLTIPPVVAATGLVATSYTDVAIVNNTLYYYVVTATNGSGESLPGNESIATPVPPAPPPAAPGNNRISLSWATVNGATSYTVKRATVGTTGGTLERRVFKTPGTLPGAGGGRRLQRRHQPGHASPPRPPQPPRLITPRHSHAQLIIATLPRSGSRP